MNAANVQDLEFLSRFFPTLEDAEDEIDRLNEELALPRGAEFFASDIHGEFESFRHTLRNGCGRIRQRIDAMNLAETEEERAQLATLVCYPQEKLPLLRQAAADPKTWIVDTLRKLMVLANESSRNFTEENIECMLEGDFDILPMCLAFPIEGTTQASACDYVIYTAIGDERGDELLFTLCNYIRRVTVNELHIVGDVYDRGPAPELIMDELMTHPNIDIQWGNHDIVWMGASQGQRGCIGNIVRMCARYANLGVLEGSYGMDLAPLRQFALKAYADDPCVAFGLKGQHDLTDEEREANIKIQKAMSIMQFKCESQIADDNPSFDLQRRNLLHRIDYEKGTIDIDGTVYELTDKVFPTIDPADPYRLTDEEEAVMQYLQDTFLNCEKLQRHMRFFLDVGSLHTVCNGNLLTHACVPLNADGSLKEVDVFGKTYKGRALFDIMDFYVREGFDSPDPEMRQRGRDIMWYLWLGEGSPLFAKSKMATLELYLTDDKPVQKEVKNPFYSLLNEENPFEAIFEDFGLDPETAHIVCGHVPVKVKKGEDPVKCKGKVLCIDGGFSKAYQPTTGIAGFTLISDAYGLTLASHEPLASAVDAIENDADIHSEIRVVEEADHVIRVAETDEGTKIKNQLVLLNALADAYRSGIIEERPEADWNNVDSEEDE